VVCKLTLGISEDNTSDPIGVIQVAGLNPDPSIMTYMVDSYKPSKAAALQATRPLHGYFVGARLPTAYDTFVVWSVEMPFSGELLAWKNEGSLQTLHTHALMFNHMYVFAAPMEDVLKPLEGLSERTTDLSHDFLDDDAHDANCLWKPAAGYSTEHLSETVTSSIGTDRTLCYYNGTGGLVDGGDGFKYDKMAPAECKSKAFSKGDVLTYIAFFSAGTDADYNGIPGPIDDSFNMHVVNSLYAKISPEDAPDTNIRVNRATFPHQACTSKDTIATAYVDPLFVSLSEEELNPPVDVNNLPPIYYWEGGDWPY